MAKTTLAWIRFASIFAIATLVAGDTKCYYPNGNAAPDTEKPCSSAAGSACCPDSWECLDNGLCHLPAGDLYGRYSCTDKDWKSPGCASNLCTYGMTLGGGEAITQCSDHNGQWCCDGDRQHVNCCAASPSARPFFDLADGKAYATIGSEQASANPTLNTITGAASSTGSAMPSTTAGSRSVSPPVTSLRTSVTSGTNGIQTIIITAVVTPSATPGTSSTKSSSNIGVIVGIVVGVFLGVAFLGIVFWMLHKRRQQKKNLYGETSDIIENDSASTAHFIGGASAKLGYDRRSSHFSVPDTAEIDSQPVGPERPISTIAGHAELDTGGEFHPGQGAPFGPDMVGLGGGRASARQTWGSVSPLNSPGLNQTSLAHHVHSPTNSDPDSRPYTLPVISENAEQNYLGHQPTNASFLGAESFAVQTPNEETEKSKELRIVNP